MTLSLKNAGDVFVDGEFYNVKNDSHSKSKISFPDSVKIAPGRTCKCTLSIKALTVGLFNSEIGIRTKEESIIIPISGMVVQIHLTERNRRILNSEKIVAVIYLVTNFSFKH